MNEPKVGEEYWTWVKPNNNTAIHSVKKVVIKDIFTVMVTANVNGSGWSIDIPKVELYKTQDEALDALNKILEKEENNK